MSWVIRGCANENMKGARTVVCFRFRLAVSPYSSSFSFLFKSVSNRKTCMKTTVLLVWLPYPIKYNLYKFNKHIRSEKSLNKILSNRSFLKLPFWFLSYFSSLFHSSVSYRFLIKCPFHTDKRVHFT